MQPFKIHNAKTARRPVDKLLAAVEAKIGFVPNVFGVVSESPPALKAFIMLNEQFAASAFDATCREIIQTATSVENRCSYCVAGHTAFAESQQVSGELIDAIRSDRRLADPKLQALNLFTRVLVRKRGMITDKEMHQFLNAGYTPEHVIEVILGICVKTFSNLANNVIGIPLDDEFGDYVWRFDKPTQAA